MIDTLLAIEREASLAAFGHIFSPDDHPYPDEAVRARMTQFIEAGAHVILDPEERGFALVIDDELHQLYVRPAAWGTGLADNLLAQAVGLGARRLWVMEKNTRARRFYEKHGWEPDGRTRLVPSPPHPTSLGYSYQR